MPALAAWHEHHDLAFAALEDVDAVPAQVLLEAASVLTRLPHGLAQPMAVVVDLLSTRFDDDPLSLPGPDHRDLLLRMAAGSVRGGAVYDALVAATARHHEATLLSLDVRATATYAAMGAEVNWL